MTTGKRGAERRDKTFAKAKLEIEAARRGDPLPPLKGQTKKHIEDDHQAAYFRWVDLMAKTDPRYLNIYAIPNGGTRPAHEGARLVKQGVRKGYPDINVDYPIWVGIVLFRTGLRIEMKKPIVPGEDKPRVSPEQQTWLTRLQKYGYICCVCYGWDKAQEATMAYMESKPVPHQWEPKP